MAFLPNIPQAADQLSISQANILNNFVILGAIAGNANPSSSSLNASSGFNWINFPNNGAIPPAGSAFPATNIGLYSSIHPTTLRNELYINKTDPGPTVVQIPATAYFANGTSGWTYLPSGIKMVWGTGTIVAGGTLLVNYSGVGAFPGFTVGATPQITRLEPAPVLPMSNFLFIQSYNSANFTVRSSAGSNNVPFLWTAIGI